MGMEMITCVIPRPNPQELFDHLKNMFSSTVLDWHWVILGRTGWYVISNGYAACRTVLRYCPIWVEWTNPEDCCCDNLYKMAARNGMFPYPPKHAEGYARLTGVPGSPIPSSFEIQTDQGTYVSVGTIPLTMPTSGTIVVRIRALVPGSEMNSAGTIATGTLVTPAPGIGTRLPGLWWTNSMGSAAAGLWSIP